MESEIMLNKMINSGLKKYYYPKILVGISTSIVMYPFLAVYLHQYDTFTISLSLPVSPSSLLLISTARKFKYHLSGVVFLSVCLFQTEFLPKLEKNVWDEPHRTHMEQIHTA